MKPLEILATASAVGKLLAEATPGDVREELARLEGASLGAPEAAGLRFAVGALALREGHLNDAVAALDEAADALRSVDAEASALARCEAWLARIRRGPRAVYAEAMEALDALAEEHAATQRVRVVARHYRATALRYSGQAEETLGMLLEAFADSEGLLLERAHVLNSLGTLYVVLGAYGAAQAVLEHAAELNHQIGDRVSEAISYGQLGSAAAARGDLASARRYLQRQEWLASQLGDTFGQARALVLLADLAIDLERPDDAVELASQARKIASSVEPPLAMWVAYATRTIGRARLDMGQPGGDAELADAQARFQKMGNLLGEALVRWDRVHHAGEDEAGGVDAWLETAWSFASLGLAARVAQVLRDRRARADEATGRALEVVVASAAQAFPHIGTAQEVELVYTEPLTLAEIATRRIGGQRNLGRMAALTLAQSGLYVAAIAGAEVGTSRSALPTARAGAALVGQLPTVALWAWPHTCGPREVARDLSAARAALGEDVRAAVGWFADARVVSTPFAGEAGARIEGADLQRLISAAGTGPAASLSRQDGLPWDAEAEALTRLAGYEESGVLAPA